MYLLPVLSLLTLFYCSGISAYAKGPRSVLSLKFLLVVSKHGARAPTHTYPRDPYKDRSIWPDGPGRITGAGKRQMFNVGEKLRTLYNGYLSEIYHCSQVLVQSTLIDRTMMSAATLLAGLYPPSGHQVWHPTIAWQPVSIYPNLLDKSLLTLDSSRCPRYWMEQNNSLTTLPELNSQYADLYRAITEGTGRNLTTAAQLYLLFNNLVAIVENGLPLPNWAEKIFLPKMLPAISQLVRHTHLKNTKMIKILTGLFLKKIVEIFQLRMGDKKTQEELDLFIHVGHDITLLSLLAAFGLQHEHVPWSSTSLLLELHLNPALPSKHEVKILKVDGRSNTSIIPEELELPHCKPPCDLTTFAAITQKYTVATMTDWQTECVDPTSPSD